MGDDLFFYELLLLALLWLYVAGYWRWPQSRPTIAQATPTPATPPRKRSRDPKPFPGLTHKPLCMTCEHAQESAPQPPGCPPPRIISTRGCPRKVDTQQQFCPQPRCRYYGWLGRGNIRANGNPSGGPWRQLHCVACGAYFLETHGTPLHGTRVPPELFV